MTKKYILGIDGGGTRTTACLADLEGRIVQEYITGSSNYKSVGIENVKDNMINAVLGVISKLGEEDKIKIESACFGIAGNDTENDLEIYKKIIFNERLAAFLDPLKTMICNDSRIGLEAGSASENRIMIICGTGSNCFGINQFGEEAYAGGWDYILGDEGSGYDIAIKALKAVMKSYDGSGRSTILNKEILKHLSFGYELEIVGWIYKKDISKEIISDIARVVCVSANMGDRISQEILENAAAEIEIIISTVAKKLKISDKEFDLVLVGSVFECKKYFKEVLLNRLKKRFNGINFKKLTKKPVLGAISLAKKTL